MDAVRTAQRLTTGAAIAGVIAAMSWGGETDVSEVFTPAETKVATDVPATVATEIPEKRCFDALRPVFAKPFWKITIERGTHDCFGSQPDETFDIDASGHVLWKERGMPDRHIELALGEKPLLAGIVDVSCLSEIEHHSEFGFLNIHPAGTDRFDADWPIEWSPARETLEMLVLRLKTRYAEDRRDKLGTITLDARLRDDDTGTWYRARIADDVLVVTRGSRVLLRKALTKQEIVELVDVVGLQGADPGAKVRGTLVAGDKKLPVGLGYLSHWGTAMGYVSNAMYCDSHTDSLSSCDSL
jgi:hypothetical protein